MTNYTADGLVPTVDWTKAHTTAPSCFAWLKVENGKFKPVRRVGAKGRRDAGGVTDFRSRHPCYLHLTLQRTARTGTFEYPATFAICTRRSPASSISSRRRG